MYMFILTFVFLLTDASISGESNFLLSLFLVDGFIQATFREELHKFYFILLGEPEFKENFAKSFISKFLYCIIIIFFIIIS